MSTGASTLGARIPPRLHLWWANASLRTKGLVVISLPLAALLLVTVVLATFLLADQDSRAAARHSLDVGDQIQRVDTLLVDAETGVRGYLLTGNDAFLTPYLQAQEEIPEALAELRALAGEDERRLAHLAVVDELTAERLALLDRLHNSQPATASLTGDIEATLE